MHGAETSAYLCRIQAFHVVTPPKAAVIGIWQRRIRRMRRTTERCLTVEPPHG